MTNKAKLQRLHFKRRVLHRFGLKLNNDQIKKIIEMIRSNRAEFLERQSNMVTLWRVEYMGENIKVVYDKRSKGLRTAMYCDMIY